MRLIGSFTDPDQATRFASFLEVEGIDARVTDADAEGEETTVWVLDEDRLVDARAHLQQFLTSPDDAIYVDAVKQAVELRLKTRLEHEAIQKELRKLEQDVKQQWAAQVPSQFNFPLIRMLLIICIAVHVVGMFGGEQNSGQRGSIESMLLFKGGLSIKSNDTSVRLSDAFSDIKKGQVWRLVTPIFAHSKELWIHILFNMLWLYQLGRILEHRFGTPTIGLLVLFSAVFSNLAQVLVPVLFLDESLSPFVGMSGVVYALLGFAWFKSKYDPRSGLGLRDEIFIIMIGFMAMGFIVPILNVANWCHLGGLVAGITFARIHRSR